MSVSTAAKPTKKIISSFIVMSILPLVIMLALNTAATIPAVIIGIISLRKSGEAIDPQDMASILCTPEAQNALTVGFIAYAVTCIVIFYLWYKKVFLKHQIKISSKEAFGPKRVILAVLLIIGTAAVINLGLIALDALAPSVMESYDQIMDSSGLGTNFLTTLIYACFLGPIAEELMFRAVTQGYLRRSGLNAVAVIFIQAVLFGIAHMNPVQSTYAIVFGLSLGLLRYKYGNIRISCLAHIVFNVYGSFGSSVILALTDSVAVFCIISAVLAAAGIVSAVIIAREPAKDVDLYKTPVKVESAPAGS